jgi:hypothetical protein
VFHDKCRFVEVVCFNIMYGTKVLYHFVIMGGCMVGWTIFGITQSIFLQPKCGSNYYIVLYIMELLNGTHFEIIDFNIYVMKLIGMKKI